MQIIFVHTITNFYYSSPSYCQEMQGDAKLHHPSEWDLQTPKNRVKTEFKDLAKYSILKERTFWQRHLHKS